MCVTNISVPESLLSAADCQGLADVLAGVGNTWTILVVGALSRGSLRYDEIQRRMTGISQRMLTLTLKRLVAGSIVIRTLLPSVPPRVDYELTPLVQTLRGALVPLASVGCAEPADDRRQPSPRSGRIQARRQVPADCRAGHGYLPLMLIRLSCEA